jgi:2-dehydro-3-deoxyphosphogluconate aldolase/(4S)-4-hydroxy-2-oxoglutarate aldolase
MREQLILDVVNTGVVAILRKVSREQIPKLGAALAEGGIRAVEVTLNTPGALGMIETLAQDPRLVVGAGTVLDAESARLAILAGARLIVTPTVNVDVIRTARRYGAIVMPGAMTPTEILLAWELGADVVKVFPAATLGAHYFKEVKAPLDQVRLMATGGVTPENAGEFIAAGADLVGMGGALVNARDLETGNYHAITDRARAVVAAIAAARA